jgi:hypothetical protein
MGATATAITAITAPVIPATDIVGGVALIALALFFTLTASASDYFSIT